MVSIELKLILLLVELVWLREIMVLSKDKFLDLMGDLKVCIFKFKMVLEVLK